ncbi:unnamed protein product [Brassica rapa]|uniref:Uncharacterized protein n=1 Tax=Brassica campestris TaxID=3711 RepID=A0A3P5YXB6_BRACM|nr:unnamed protein product [Brassica rapa]VDC68294.1 unnamed protein product [Brassica rapa]
MSHTHTTQPITCLDIILVKKRKKREESVCYKSLCFCLSSTFLFPSSQPLGIFSLSSFSLSPTLIIFDRSRWIHNLPVLPEHL